MPAAKFEIKRKCQVCGQEFIAKTIESWYCSKRCSNIAYKRRKDEEKRNQRLDEIVKSIPKHQDYIKVHINLGTNQIRVSKEELLKLYPLRKKALAKPKPVAKLYSLDPKDCYTIGEISKKFHLEDSTVYLHIRKYSIPTRQIGNFVYAPKKEIDNLYKGAKQ